MVFTAFSFLFFFIIFLFSIFICHRHIDCPLPFQIFLIVPKSCSNRRCTIRTILLCILIHIFIVHPFHTFLLRTYVAMYIRRSKKAWEMIKGPIQFETEFMIPRSTYIHVKFAFTLPWPNLLPGDSVCGKNGCMMWEENWKMN